MRNCGNKFTRFFLGLFLLSSTFCGSAAGFLLPESSFAAVFDVTNSKELRDALTTAQTNGEDDTINISAGTFGAGGTTFTYTPTEDRSLAIIGAGAMSTFLDGGNSVLVLSIDTTTASSDSAADITISNLTIQNGNNTATPDGGGLFVLTNSASVTIGDCTFIMNSITSSERVFGGGAEVVTNAGGNIILTNNTFDGNLASSSSEGAIGGGAAFAAVSGGEITLTGNTFNGNSASSSSPPPGGGARGGGAAIAAVSEGEITLTGNTFNGNSVNTSSAPADGFTSGGGVDVVSESGPNITLTSNTFTGNSINGSSELVFGGGAEVVAIEGGNIILTNNAFTGNSVNNSSDLTGGGGLDVFAPAGGDITLTNNTVTLNLSTVDGGGLSAFTTDDTSTLNIYNNIVFGNTATRDGNDIFLVEDNDENNVGSFVNLFNNDFSGLFSFCENMMDCTSNTMQGSNIDADPLFVDAPGGDVHLKSGSPAIDAGDPNAPHVPDTDIFGNPRVPPPDMGAVEFISFGGGGGCTLTHTAATSSLPVFLALPVLIVFRRVIRKYRVGIRV